VSPHAPELQSESVTQLRQILPAQTGASNEQSLFWTHCTHASLARLHTGVAPLQSLFARHCTQVPLEQIASSALPPNPGHCELLSQLVSQSPCVAQNGNWALQSDDDAQVSATHWFAMHVSPSVHM
jgi:hypothetical protein